MKSIVYSFIRNKNINKKNFYVNKNKLKCNSQKLLFIFFLCLSIIGGNIIYEINNKKNIADNETDINNLLIKKESSIINSSTCIVKDSNGNCIILSGQIPESDVLAINKCCPTIFDINFSDLFVTTVMAENTERNTSKTNQNSVKYTSNEAIIKEKNYDISNVIKQEDNGSPVKVLDDSGDNLLVEDINGIKGYINKNNLVLSLQYVFNSTNTKIYTRQNAEILAEPFENSDIIEEPLLNSEYTLIGKNNYDYWKILLNDGTYGYINKNEISTEQIKAPVNITSIYDYAGNWNGARLNPSVGTIIGPSGKETYYNLPMNGVINIMRSLGYDEENYPYGVREDGVKTLGGYIMVAADLGVHPRGSLVETSLGTAIVCDTGTFALTNRYQLDVAVTW